MKELTADYLKSFLKGRDNNSHKGCYGHLLIVAGCQDMPGAAVLATSAALQSGCGLVTLHSTRRALDSAAVNCPSAMLSQDSGDCFSQLPRDLSRYNAVCIGPGLGKAACTLKAFSELLEYCNTSGTPMLIDADALNLLAENPVQMAKIPEGSILTPHPGELKRLLDSVNAGTDITVLNGKCRSVIIAKGYHSHIIQPGGDVFINPTGGPSLAKAGSGDVLTGLTAGLMARGYSAIEASLLGTWIHGATGDILSQNMTMESFNSLHLAQNLYRAFSELYSGSTISRQADREY